MSDRILPALASAALALALAACGGASDGPVTTPPPAMGNGASDGGGPEEDPSDGGGEQTEDAKAAAPDVPAPDPADYPGMDEETPEGAEQALRYYIAVVYWGYQTGDTETLVTLYTENCEQCDDITEEVLNVAKSETYWDSAPIQHIGTDSDPGDDTDLHVSYGYRISAHKENDPEMSAQKDVEEVPYTGLAGMNWSDNKWSIDWLLLAESYHAE